jgi:hypothetical protein
VCGRCANFWLILWILLILRLAGFIHEQNPQAVLIFEYPLDVPSTALYTGIS